MGTATGNATLEHMQSLMRNSHLTQSFMANSHHPQQQLHQQNGQANQNSSSNNLPVVPTSSPLFYRDEQFRSSPMSPSLFLQPSERRESTASPFISNPPPLPPPPPPHLKSAAIVNYSSTMSFSNISQQNKPHLYQSQIIGNCVDASIPSHLANLHALAEVGFVDLCTFISVQD